MHLRFHSTAMYHTRCVFGVNMAWSRLLSCKNQVTFDLCMQLLFLETRMKVNFQDVDEHLVLEVFPVTAQYYVL